MPAGKRLTGYSSAKVFQAKRIEAVFIKGSKLRI
jgi:hypothetical protein